MRVMKDSLGHAPAARHNDDADGDEFAGARPPQHNGDEDDDEFAGARPGVMNRGWLAGANHSVM